MRLASVCAVLLLLVLVNSALPADDGKGNVELRKRLLKTWKRQRDEIVTARIVLKHYRWAAEASNAQPADMNMAQFRTFIDNARELVPKDIYASIRGVFKGGLEFNTVISVDGQNVRNENEQWSVVLKDGKEYRFDKFVKQVDLLPSKSGVQILDHNKIRYIPYVVDVEDLTKISIEQSVKDELRVRFYSWVLNVDRVTSNVIQGTVFVNGDKPYTSRFHLGDKTVSQDGFLPEVAVRVDYDTDGKVRFVDTFLLIENVINKPVNPSVFTMAIPKGTVVVDEVQGKGSMTRTQQDEPDIDKRAAPSAARSSQQHSWWPLWISLGMIVIALFAWALMRRRVAD
ncbi:MAG: hypothetical protein K2W96_25050 [Gemmataceae bacterium]|nr:hypothetical protein [Gemmataceae bacterium]